MKLLIVDDEELTRTGLATSIDWKSLEIDEVLQADDGVNGLEMARLHRPEIVLCDVRMPRMDGIAMVERIEAILPDTIPVFMSGYSDKEYLMAAIRLRAVNYIEKPLNPPEIRETILEAQRAYRQKQHSHHGETISSIETASRLAQRLTLPYSDGASRIAELAQSLALPFDGDTWFTSVIFHLSMASDVPLPALQEIVLPLQKFLKTYKMDCICTARRTHFHVYFLFGNARPSSIALQSAVEFLQNRYASVQNYYVTAGESVRGIPHAYQSYASAVVLLQNSYFFPANSYLTGELLARLPVRAERHFSQTSAPDQFSKLLLSQAQEDTQLFLEHLFDAYEKNTACLPNQVKDLYYKLFIALENARREKQIPFSSAAMQENIVDALETSFSYEELHATLTAKTAHYFEEIQQTSTEHPTIFTIKDYIGKNYANETLSVKDISDHVFLSTSYVCTFFKNETGQTLNQYLTEYRMEKAKSLLADPRYKITDISAKVGYSDGNYFGKSFKKYTGLSPSEFREKIS